MQNLTTANPEKVPSLNFAPENYERAASPIQKKIATYTRIENVVTMFFQDNGKTISLNFKFASI